MKFRDELHLQRWDDHRFYHQDRINQTCHLVSASCFITSYLLLLINPAAAAIVGWTLAMVVRQIGHFFFESRSFDHLNQASHEHKEMIKVGYNLSKKAILLCVWAGIPILLFYTSITFFGLLEPTDSFRQLVTNTGLVWLWLGIIAVLFRVVQLFKSSGVQSGIVWMTKILTDPFHDIKIYHKAPLFLMRGERYDDMTEWYREIPAGAEQ